MRLNQSIVGVYRLGMLNVQVVLREGYGGDAYCRPDDVGVPRIKLGAEGKWENVVDRLLHESAELYLELHHHRYLACANERNDPASVRFMFTHAEFSDLCAVLGVFAACVLPDLADAWKKFARRNIRATASMRRKTA